MADMTVCPKDGTMLTPLAKGDLVGTVIAEKYKVLDRIGDGGMGQVYKAKHVLMKRIVAIKVLLPSLVSSGPALKRFQQEAEAASSLNHPNILTVFDFGVSENGLPYMVMDFLEGITMAQVLDEEGHLDLHEAVPIFIQCCAGLAHAHQKGVIHRDLKPSNVMLVDFDGQPNFVKIFDFGIAKLIPTEGDESKHLTQTGDVFGSPLYMSPEQCGGKELDHRSDIYSLACVMYRCLTGCPPLAGSSLVECMYKHVNEMPPRFSDICPEYSLPEAVEAIIFKAMAKSRDDRYSSMSELKEALEKFLAEGEQKPPPPQSISQRLSAKLRVVPSHEDSSETYPLGATGSSQTIIGTQFPTGQVTQMAQAAPPPVQQPPSLLERLKAHKIALIALGIGIIAAAIIAALTMHGNLPAAESSLFNKGKAAFDKGNYAEAEPYLELASKELGKGKESEPQLAACYNLLGKIHIAQGEYDEALRNLNRAMELQKGQNAGPTAMAATMTDLGVVNTALNNNKAAEQNLKAALKLREKAKDDPQQLGMAETLSGLGYLSMKQGQLQNGVNYLKHSLDIRETALGKDNPVVASAMTDLGQAYQMEKAFGQAEKMYREALGIRQAKLSKDDPLIADSFYYLGAVLASQRKFDESASMLKQSIEINEQVHGPARPTLSLSRTLLSKLKGKSGGKNSAGWLE
jgi:serine/threonine-protein kinase